ncbi:MAG: membrane-bound lytic murein transglycosylase MltF [Acidiferrobacteraceae bacterium]|jgi:membrane-bound lytic murein transglycosylase F
MRLALLALLGFSVALSGCEPRPANKLQAVKQSGELVVLTRNSSTTYYEGPDGYLGVEYDMAKAFADHLGVKLRMVVPDHFSEILRMLANNEADMAAAGLSITKERKKIVRFAPPYQHIRQQVVYRSGTKRPRKISDLVGSQIVVPAGTTYADRLAELQKKYPQLAWTESTKLGVEDLLQMVADGTLAYTIADSNIVDANRILYPDLHVGFEIQHPESLAWAFPLSDDDSLYDAAVHFQRHLRRSGEIKVLLERYYGAAQSNYFNITLYQLRIRDQLPLYRSMFQRSGERHDIDWRLLAAISYQESYWNPQAISPTGVEGMMMLTDVTAKQLGVADRLDAEQAIEGGATYLRSMIDKLPQSITEPDRTWMALASYNVGYRHLLDARKLTAQQGANPDKWNAVKQRLPLLAKPQYYKHASAGYARGWEPVDFVGRIRRYYEILVKLQQKERDLRRNYAIDLVAPAI